MKLAIIGVGYVGLVTGTCFAEMGNKVLCVDLDKRKIQNLQQGIMPIYEKGLEELVNENMAKGDLQFTTDIKLAVENSDVCFIAVGTPETADGSADLSYVLSAAQSIGQYMNKHMYIVDKSTVPVGTAEKVKKTIQQELDARKSSLTFSVISNPEFLKEGVAIEDCMKPDRVVIGADNEAALAVMRELYAPFVRNTERFIAMDVKSAEMTKYAANAMLATKISFINEIANICERVGADVNKVRVGIGSDSRIGYSFIYPGCGYGGSCFPKDVVALQKTANDHGYTAKLLQAVDQVNDAQKLVIVEKILAKYGEDLAGRTFAVWGLAFKPNTDDMREATSLVVVNELTRHGARIKAYDAQAIKNAQEHHFAGNEKVSYASSKYSVLKDSDALILLTEWKEFRSPDFGELALQLKEKVIFDGRNQYNREQMQKMGFEYHQIGVRSSTGSRRNLV